MRSWCKTCQKLARKQWKLNNPDRIAEHLRKWRKKNPNRNKELKNNRDHETRRTTKGKLNHGISRSIWDSLKRGSKAGRHWETLVGYTVNELKQHLEKKFTLEMSWANHGSCWHIDHKIPIAAFNFEKPEDIDFKRCWALKNLQPLKARENESKGARIKKPFQPSLNIELEKQ